MSNIFSDNKNNLLVDLTEVFPGKGKKNGIYVSVYLRNTDTTFVGVISGVLLLFYSERGDYTTLFTEADQTSVSKERARHFFDETRMKPPFP